MIGMSLVLVLTGCMTTQKFTHVQKQEVIRTLDFTKYQEKGFLITPGDYSEEHDDLGMFSLSVYPEARFESPSIEETYPRWVYDDVDTHEVLDLLYEEAVKKGADAAIHFKIDNTTRHYFDGQQNFEISGLEISGSFIRRWRPSSLFK